MTVESFVAGPAVVVALKTATLGLGATITHFALKAYRRTGSPALRAVAVGFSLVTTGAVIGGVTHQLTRVSLRSAVLIESLFFALGFLVLTWSLYADRG